MARKLLSFSLPGVRCGVNMKVKRKILTLAALPIFVLSVLLSIPRNSAAFQFVDRILRPCGGTSTGSVIVTTTDINLVPCPGGSVNINGVPITPGAGLPDPGYSISLTPSYTLDASTDIFTLTAINLNEDYSRFIAAKVPALLSNNVTGRWFNIALSHTGLSGPWKLFGLKIIFSRLTED